MLDRIIKSGGSRRTGVRRTSTRRSGLRAPMRAGRGDGLRAGIRAGARKPRSTTRKPRATSSRRPANPWIAHVKKFARDHGLTYAEALRSPGLKRGYKKKA